MFLADGNKSIVVEIPELKRRGNPESTGVILKQRIWDEAVGFAVAAVRDVENGNLPAFQAVQVGGSG